MQPKKNPKVSLENKKAMFFQIGLAVTLLAILIAFEWKSYDKSNVIDFAVKVMEQDGDACELNQKGLYNPGVVSGVLMPEEYEVKRFQDWVRKKMKV